MNKLQNKGLFNSHLRRPNPLRIWFTKNMDTYIHIYQFSDPFLTYINIPSVTAEDTWNAKLRLEICGAPQEDLI